MALMKFNLSILKRREFRNSAWNTADVLLLPMLMLLATPFFIKRLGPADYGIWMIVNSIVFSLGIINIGTGDAAIKFISKYHALNDNVNIKRIASSAFTLSIVVTAFIIIAGTLLFFIIRNFNFLNIDDAHMMLASGSILLGSIVFGMKQMEQLALSIFKGFERYDTSSIMSIISKSLLLTGQVAVVYKGYSLLYVFLISAITTVVVVFFEYIYVKIKIRSLSFIPHFEKAAIREIFSFSSWSWTQSVLSIIAGQADRFVVISLAGPKFLAYYALASTIGGQIHQVFTAAISWVFPKVSGKTERKEDLLPLYYKMQFLVMAGGTIIIGTLILFQRQIFLRWLGWETYIHSILLIKLFLYLAFINMVSIVPYFFLLGANKIKVSALFMFISVLLTILMMVIFYHFAEVNGLAYGKVLSSLISIPMMLMFVHFKIIEKKDRKSVFILYGAVLLLVAGFYLENLYSFILVGLALIIIKMFYDYKLKSFAAV
jgi:O-antigen/teichoic acid export membrane protein